MTPPFEDDSIVARAPEALWRRVLGGVLVLGPCSDDALELTSPGDVVWALLGDPISVGALVEALSEGFAVSGAVVRAEIASTLDALADVGALVVFDPAESDQAGSHPEGEIRSETARRRSGTDASG